MKGTDKYLIGIVVGIVLLIVVALAVVLLRPEADYRSDVSPEAVVHNYLLALRKGNYERAYESLSPKLDNYPEDLDTFIENIDSQGWKFRLGGDVALNVQPATIRGEGATVEVLETIFSGNGLFDSGQSDNEFYMRLRQEEGTWKLFDGNRYWTRCWNQEDSKLYWCPQ